MLVDRLGIVPGKTPNNRTLLIIGASGGVGSIMTQLATRLTSLTVIGTASRPETQAWVKELGAHHVIDHSRPIAEELKRIGIPAVMGGLIGVALQPYFVSIGWLQAGDPPRKIMFLIALGAIMGAALVDMALIFARALPHARRQAALDAPQPVASAGLRIDGRRLVLWVVFWAGATVACGHWLLGQPVFFLVVAVALVFVFALVNGISVGVSDANPISSAFVVTIVILAALGLRDPGVGLMAGAVLLVATGVACDMQQDRSTGWRLGT
jgi:hypothetical protein